MSRTKENIRAYRLGEESAGREADCPFDGLDPQSRELADEWHDGRDNAELAMGEEFADSCDPSMRDVYE